MDFNENTVEGTSKNGISFKTFKSRTGLHEFKKTISLANEFTNIQAKKSIQNHNIFKEFSVDTLYIKQCVVQNQTTYSFKIIPKIITSNSIFNLIVHNKNDVWETTIIEMMPSKQNLKDLISGSSDQFKGKMRLIYQSNPFQKSNNNHSARATTTGTSYTTIFVESSHCTGTGKCASGTCDKCNLCVSYSSYRVPVTGEAVEAIEESPNGDTQGSGGGNGSSYSDPSGYVIDPNLFDVSHPKAYLILQKAEKAAAFWTDLLNVQKEWAVDKPEKYIKVIEFYLENTSPESKAFANFAINFLKDNSDVTWEQFENWFMGTPEGQDGEYDAAFWENPNLTFQQQSLPSYNNYFNNMARFANGDLMKGADNVYSLVGGAVHQARIDNPKRTENTCALKVSIALVRSDIVIPNLPGITLEGSGEFAGNFFFLNTKELNAWMRKTFGTNTGIGNTPINNKHLSYNAADGGPNGEDFPNKLKNIYGIYSMITTEEYDKKGASGHADLLFTDSKGFGNCPFYCFFNLPIQRIDIWILE